MIYLNAPLTLSPNKNKSKYIPAEERRGVMVGCPA
jgi:hypothetical protein